MFERISQNSELNDVIGSSRFSSGDTPSSDRKDMIPKEIGDDTKESNKYKDADDNRKAEEPDPPKEIGEADTEKTGISEKIREKLLAGGMSEQKRCWTIMGLKLKECFQNLNQNSNVCFLKTCIKTQTIIK